MERPWQTTKPIAKAGFATLISEEKLYLQIESDGLWDLGDQKAQESVANNRRRFFHTFVETIQHVRDTVKQLKRYWDKYYADERGRWDYLDPLIYKYGTQFIIIIPDIVFMNAKEQIAFTNAFNSHTGLSLPTSHLEKSSYRWPLANQTLRGTKIKGIKGTGVSETRNSAVIDYDNE